jgi:diguanylate cyclase
VAAIDEDAVQRASIELARLIASVADSAARTGDQAGRFGETLGGLEAALAAGDVQRLAPVLTRAIENTAVMKDSAAALAHEVASSRQEIERLRQDLSRARDEALFDTLTKVLNRKGFEQRLAAMLASEAPDGTAHALVMVDLDRFKSVNDTYGHMMGDRVLQAVGEVLRRCVVDPAHTVARFGGEEFAILVPASPPDAARALAEHCRETVRALRVRDRRTSGIILSVTISAGVASLRPGEDGSGLIARADKALYAAKAAGRDCVEMG